MDKVECKNFKDNHVYYACDTNNIFLVHTDYELPYFCRIEFLDLDGDLRSSTYTYAEIYNDAFYGIELGEL